MIQWFWVWQASRNLKSISNPERFWPSPPLQTSNLVELQIWGPHVARSDSPCSLRLTVLTHTHRAHSDSPCSLRLIVLTQTHCASSRLEPPPEKKKRFPQKIEPATWLWARNMTGNAIRMQFWATVRAQWHRAGSIFHEVFVFWVWKLLGEKKLSEQHESEPVTLSLSPYRESEPATWVWARNMPMLKAVIWVLGILLKSPKSLCILLGVLTPKLHGNEWQSPKYNSTNRYKFEVQTPCDCHLSTKLSRNLPLHTMMSLWNDNRWARRETLSGSEIGLKRIRLWKHPNG